MEHESKVWHPVATAASVEASRVHGTILLGQPIVVWRAASGMLHAWADQCPHRGAALSLGCVKGERLQCGYHGWEFGGASRACEFAPSQPGKVPLAQIRAAYDVQEAYGMIWVRLSSSESEVPPFPEFAHPHLRKIFCGPYDVETSAPRIVENFLDMAHFGFIHPNILGDAAHAEVPDYEVRALDSGQSNANTSRSPRAPFTEGKATQSAGVIATRCFAYQPKSNATISGGSMVEYTYRVPAPYTSILTKIPTAQNGFEEAIALFAQPITEETSRVWFVLAMTDFSSPEATLQQFQDTIFAQDKPIVESQTPKRLPLDLRAEAHGAADKMSSAYRRYLASQHISFGVIPIAT
jgi:phenylpropionate dioxygenase-like ring-hydroxylating dioxygenase large terminal subunit